MLSQLALLVEHVAARLRLRVEHRVERRCHGGAADITVGGGEVALQVRGEDDARHGEPVS